GEPVPRHDGARWRSAPRAKSGERDHQSGEVVTAERMKISTGDTGTAAHAGALLCVADYHGTLAATRSLGRAGISVTVADWRRLVPARWSRYAERTVSCPGIDADALTFMSWLFD